MKIEMDKFLIKRPIECKISSQIQKYIHTGLFGDKIEINKRDN